MKFEDKEIKSVAELLEALKQNNILDPVWFRGNANISWKLIPSVARGKNAVDAEFTLMKRFKQNAMPFLINRPLTDWDWLFLMQHHGVPTRLLDWTESPLIGLYFAVFDNKHARKDGALWCLLPKVLNQHANYTPGHVRELPFFGVDIFLDNYLPAKISQERTSSLNPVAAMSERESRRLYAQLGVFTITHRKPTPIEEIGDQNHIWRFVIPARSKKEIHKELTFLSINKLALFPELPSVAEVAKEILR
jgi:FRG domain-containing protein